jgi:hypothetical protein
MSRPGKIFVRWWISNLRRKNRIQKPLAVSFQPAPCGDRLRAQRNEAVRSSGIDPLLTCTYPPSPTSLAATSTAQSCGCRNGMLSRHRWHPLQCYSQSPAFAAVLCPDAPSFSAPVARRVIARARVQHDSTGVPLWLLDSLWCGGLKAASPYLHLVFAVALLKATTASRSTAAFGSRCCVFTQLDNFRCLLPRMLSLRFTCTVTNCVSVAQEFNVRLCVTRCECA